MIETGQLAGLKAKGKNSSRSSNTSTGLTWLERFGYGLGDMSYNIVFQFVNAYLLFYYTDVGGIHPVVIATLFLVVRILDAIFDPIHGDDLR
jgi:probable glucitol transport protein GutA